MVGKRKFDEAVVLDAAAAVFREHGFDGASIDHLTAATGVKRGSLYNAYGSKEGLFQAAFARYAATMEEALLANLDRRGVRDGLAALFAALRSEAAKSEAPCLIARSLGDCAAEVSAGAARTRHQETVERLCARLERAREAGEVPAETDCAALAMALAAQMRALSLLGRAGGMPGAGAAIEAAALRLLPKPD